MSGFIHERGMMAKTKYRLIVYGMFLSVASLLFTDSTLLADTIKDMTVEQAFPGFASGILKDAKMANLKKGILLASEGLEIGESRIVEAVAKANPKIRDELRKNQFFLLEQETIKEVMRKEAVSSGMDGKGLSDMEIIQAFLNQKASDVKVSEDETKAFYETNKAMVGGAPFDQVREAIHQVLLQQKRQDAVDSYLQGLGGKTDIRINMEWVKAQHALAKNNPVDKARTSGKPTMVEFGATGCVPCDMMQPILENLRKNYPDKLNVVFVHVGENRIMGARFGIQSIPVQVFYDKAGKEVFRHVGFFAETEVVKQLQQLGVK